MDPLEGFLKHPMANRVFAVLGAVVAVWIVLRLLHPRVDAIP